MKQKDNNTYSEKVMLRQTAVSLLTEPLVVMETHGGIGDLWAAVYRDVEDGVVFEKRPDRTTLLATQRPTWAVYEGNSERAIALGAGAHLCVNLLDVDPYGDPWPTIQAFFGSERPFAREMVVVVNDGLRQAVRGGTAWNSKTLEPVVQRFGNELWDQYLAACQWLMEAAAAVAGYQVVFFDGYYCGTGLCNTHYVARLVME